MTKNAQDLVLATAIMLVLFPIVIYLVKRIFKHSVIFTFFLYMSALIVLVSILGFVVGRYGVVNMFWTMPTGLVLIGIALYVAYKNISIPLGNVISELSRLKSGDLNGLEANVMKAAMTRKDEIGVISQSLNDYFEFEIQTSNFATALGNGNFNYAFEPRSADDTIGLALLSMKDNLESTLVETNLVVREASEGGKLSVRINEDFKEGYWLQMAQTTNRLLDSFYKPLQNLNYIIGAMSTGDVTKRYTDEAKGDIAAMAKSLNTALENLDGLLSQVSVNAMTMEESANVMKSSSQEMGINTSEIANSIAEMSSGAQAQVAKVDESFGLIEAIMKSSQVMAENASEINNAAKVGVANSETGTSLLADLEQHMSVISENSYQTKTSIEILSQRSNEIQRVLAVISEIAAQTNLLALNAAIEAAQAGDAGRGFAVVAEEIRKLAENSKKSAKEIETLVFAVRQDTDQASSVILNMDASVKKGVETTKGAGSAFKTIYESTTQTLRYAEEIVEATTEQIEGINKVVNITESIVVIAEQTAAGTEEIASSSMELSSVMDSYNQKTASLAELAESFKQGISMVKISNSADINNTIFKIREAYEQEKSLLDSLMGLTPDYIYFKDKDSKFIRVTASMARDIAGSDDPSELIGKSDFDLFGEHARSAFEDEKHIMETRKPLLNKVEKEDRKDGTQKWVETTKLPLIDYRGEIVGTFGISRDISKLKLAEIANETQAREIEQKMAELEKMRQLGV